MAEESLSELYFRLGLDTSALDSGFIDAQQSLSKNLKILNRHENLIQIKTQADLTGLNEAAISTEGLRIKQEALAQQLEIQKDRIQLTAAAYQEMVQAQGEDSVAAYNLAVTLEQERIAMAKLEQQSQALTEQQRIQLGVNWEMLGAIEPALKVTDVWAGARTAVTLFGRAIPVPQIKIATAALIGLSAVIAGTVDATDELAEDNAAQILNENFQTSAEGISNSLTTVRNDVIRTTDVVNQLQHARISPEQNTTIIDWARDIFRISFLLVEESDSFGDAISKINSQSQFMRTEIGNYAVVLAGTTKIFQALHNEAINFVEPSIEGFKELKQRAYELNLPLSETTKWLSLIDLAGADYNDVRDYVRGVQDAVIKGDSEDPEVIALSKYGVVIQDTNGKLLSFNATLENLYEGFLKAEKAGEEEAYVIMTNGQAVQDVLPFFKELANAKIKFNEIQWSTSDYAALRQTSTDLKLMQVQADELQNSLESLALPLADYSAQAKFDIYKKLTEWVEENRETILKWEFVFIGALDRIEEKASNASNKIKNILSDVGQAIAEFFKAVSGSENKQAEESLFSLSNLLENKKRQSLWNKEDIKLTYEYFPELVPKGKTVDQLIEEHYTPSVTEKISEKLKEYVDYFKESYAQILDNADQDLEEYIAENEKARDETQKTSEEITAGLSYSYNRIAKYKEELANTKIDYDFGNDEYGKSLAKLDIWYDKAMQDARYYAEEREVIEELYNAKVELIEKQHAEKLAEIRESIAASRRTDLENALAEIEREKEARINAGMEAAEAIKLAAEESAAAIKNLEDAFTEKVNNFRNNALENQFAAIDKDRDNWIKKGINPEEANAFADEQKNKARKDLEESFSDRINQIRNNDLENQFARIEKEKQAWIDKGIDEARAEEFANEAKGKALDEYNAKLEKSNKEATQGADEVKGHWERVGKSIDEQFNEAFSVLKSQLDAFRAYRDKGIEGLIEHEREQLHKQGITDEDLRSMTTEALNGFQKAMKDIRENLLPNFKPQENWEYILDPVKKQFDGLNESVNQSTKSENDKTKANDTGTKSVYNFGSALDEAAKKLANSNNPSQQNQQPNPNYNQTNTPSYKTSKVTVPPPYDFKGYAEGEGGKYWLFSRPGGKGPIINSKDYPDALSALNDINKGNPFYKQPEYNPEDMLKKIGTYSDSMSDKLGTATQALGDLAANHQDNNYNTTNNSRTIEAPISVEINNPQAWDTEHIQELADKVAGQIEPAIANAIGGGSNSY